MFLVLYTKRWICRGGITKRILLLQAFPTKENRHYSENYKSIPYISFHLLSQSSFGTRTPFCNAAVAKSMLCSSTMFSHLESARSPVRSSIFLYSLLNRTTETSALMEQDMYKRPCPRNCLHPTPPDPTPHTPAF